MKLKYVLSICLSSFLFFNSCTNLNEELYSEVSSSNFYNNKEELTSALLLPYKHLMAIYERIFWCEELAADHFTLASKGPHGYDGGIYARVYQHKMTPEDTYVLQPWNKFYEGVGHVNNVLGDIEKLDYSKIGLTEVDKQSHISEMKILRAYFYYQLLSVFGDVPIVTSLDQMGPKKSHREKVFAFIEKEILENVEYLPKGDVSSQYGRMNQAAAYMILAKMYLNAEIHMGEKMYDKCLVICNNIIDGKYGNFELAKKWYEPFDYNNDKCKENIFSLPCDYVNTGKPFYIDWFYHYNTFVYFDCEPMGYNAIHLAPSHAPTGEIYDFNGLGTPYESFDDKDLRKRPFNGADRDNGGMFLIGLQKSPITGEISMGSVEYSGEPLVFVDYVARTKLGETNTGITNGEENTGVRFVKYGVYPTSEKDKYYQADIVVFRLADVYYMKAECLLRTGGNMEEVVNLINNVKKRNFADSDWNTKLYKSITLDELLRDRGREFMGECFRRTDLIRFGRYHEAYWEKELEDKNNYLLPIPNVAINSNPNLNEFEE